MKSLKHTPTRQGAGGATSTSFFSLLPFLSRMPRCHTLATRHEPLPKQVNSVVKCTCVRVCVCVCVCHTGGHHRGAPSPYVLAPGDMGGIRAYTGGLQ